MEVYIKSNKLYPKIYRKETDRQKFFYINSEHPISLKNSMPYSQVLKVKCAHSTIKHFELYCSQLKQNFFKKGYNSDLLYRHITTVEKLDQNEMLQSF